MFVSNVCNILSSLGCIDMVMQTALQERENQVSSTLSSGKMMSKFAFRNR